MVAKTSLMAYDELVASGKEETQRCKVLEMCLACQIGVTRRRLASLTGIELGAVAGRVNALVEDGLLDDSEMVVCPTTRKAVKLIRPVGGGQQEMFS